MGLSIVSPLRWTDKTFTEICQRFLVNSHHLLESRKNLYSAEYSLFFASRGLFVIEILNNLSHSNKIIGENKKKTKYPTLYPESSLIRSRKISKDRSLARTPQGRTALTKMHFSTEIKMVTGILIRVSMLKKSVLISYLGEDFFPISNFGLWKC